MMKPSVMRKLAASAREKARREANKAAGVCMYCARPDGMSSGRMACDTCRAKQAASHARRRERRRANSICVDCESPRLASPWRCRECLDKVNYWCIVSRANAADRREGVECDE